MSYFSTPLANNETTKSIIKLLLKNRSTLKRGITACTKSIQNKEEGLLIIASNVSPEDLVSYMPPLAEENRIPYIFVESMECLSESNEYLKPTACCFIKGNGVTSKTLKKILKESYCYE